MSTSIQCACSLSEDLRWHCQWATLAPNAQVDRHVAFALRPPEFIGVIRYLEQVLGHPAESTPRPEVASVNFRLRFRHSARLYELQIHGEAGGLKAMVDKPQMAQILAYHKSCLQAFAVAIYEGRVPNPEG